jgi:hypothetical protein
MAGKTITNSDYLLNRRMLTITTLPRNPKPFLQVRKLLNAGIAYTNPLKGVQNRLTFTVQTITDIFRGGGIIIKGPAYFIFEENCGPETTATEIVEGSGMVPRVRNITCISIKEI